MPAVDIPEIGTVEFPDSMSQADIVSAIERDIAPKSKAPARTDSTRSGSEAWANRLNVPEGSFNAAFQPPQIVSDALDKLFPSFKPESTEVAQLIQMAGLEPTRQVAETLAAKVKGAIGSVLSPGGAVLAAAAPVAPELVGGVTAALGGQQAVEGAKEIAKGGPSNIAGGAADVLLGGTMIVGGAAGALRGKLPATAKALEDSGVKIEPERTPNATETRNLPENVQPERVGTDALGTAAEAGVGNRVLGETPKPEEAVTPEASVTPTAEASFPETKAEPFPPELAPTPSIPADVLEAQAVWKKSEKRWRRAMRQEPSDIADAEDARIEAQGIFRDKAAAAGLTQEQFDALRRDAEMTETEQTEVPTPTPPAKVETGGAPEPTWMDKPLSYWKANAVPQKLGKSEWRTRLAKQLGVKDAPASVANGLQGIIRDLEAQRSKQQRKIENEAANKQDADQLALIEKIEKGEPVEQADVDRLLQPDSEWRKKAVIKPPQAPGISVDPGEDISSGPGATSPHQKPTDSELAQLTKAVETTQPVKKPLVEAVKSDLTKAWEQVTEKWESALGNLSSLGKQAMANLKGEHPWTDFKDALGKFSGANNRSDFELQQFTHAIKKAVPDEMRRQAIVNWIQADGDNALLAGRAASSKGTIQKGYEVAQSLTPDELILAGNVKNYLDAKLQEGMDAGLLKAGIENYVTQIWDRPNPVTNKLIGEAVSGKLAPNFKYARQRIFESYFEGEQAGFKPKQKDIGFLIAAYDRAFSRAIAGRELIKSLHEGTASDGRPLVEISGVTDMLSENGNPSALLILPKVKPEELGGYLEIAHPSLRGWKWAGTDQKTGATILYQGNMVVHPEVYTHLKNVLSSSALRENVFFRGLLETQALLKQSKLALSGFHFTQEGAHAAAHRVNPLAPGKIDFSIPDQSALVDHGLQIADYRAYQAFSEGVSGAGSIYEKVPVVGKWLTRYNEYLFQEYIPRLKMTMAMDALERNRARFKGKLSDDQILELTANQSNAAFGELNYNMIGRNPTYQDFIRLTFLAPDFLEARFRFAAQALTKTGTEQRVAIGLQAITLYTAARILNQALDGDPHWEPKYAFEVIANKRRYGIRTVAEDTMHLITDPAKFLYNRLAPLSKGLTEYVTGRDWRGINRTSVQQLEDIASWLLPITAQHPSGESKIDTALQASGITVRPATAQQRLYDAVNKFKEDHNLVSAAEKAGMIAPSEYGPLRNALRVGTEAEARKEYETLLHPSDGTTPRTEAQIRRHFIDAVRTPVGGSKKIENQFLSQADQKTKDLFLEARKERQETAVKMIQLAEKWAKEKQK